MTYKKPELLIPASSLEVLRTAVMFGADAVYIGGEAFGLRAKAKNFSSEEMAEGVAFAHAHGVKVYVTANILAHNYDLDGARKYFAELRDMKPEQPDALIISDPGMFMIAKEVWPQVEVHISTQANNTNYETYLFWWKLGAKRVVSARELSLVEIKGIREKIPAEMEIESFVHGAMCISYSGRCLLSNFFTGRDANRGACTHPCRWKYAVVEETRPGQFADFCAQVGTLCHVTWQDDSAENISEQYYDTQSRLETAQIKLARLQELLKKAENMEDIITIESAISETEYEIERLSGTVRHYDALVDYATVTLELSEVYRLSGTEDAPKSFGEKLGNAFTDGLAAVREGLEDFAIWLAYSWLGILIFAAVVFAAVKLIGQLRRGQKLPKLGRKKNKNTANETKVEE